MGVVAMTNIDAGTVKKLRETTGAGMMDCKKALVESKGDFESAVDWLKKKGLAAAAKKSGRVAAEGLVSVAISGNTGALVELNSETDFVARNDKFQTLAKNIAEVAVKAGGDIEKLKSSTYPATGKSVADTITESIATIGENINLRRTGSLSVSQGVLSSYVHSSIAPSLGKIGVLVALESTGARDKLETAGKQLAMHIAASRPEFLNSSDISAEKLNREKQTFTEQSNQFLKKFRELESKLENYKAKLTGKRAFSEKIIESKLDELSQFTVNLADLEEIYATKINSEDRKEKQDAEKTKKLLEVFYQEANYLLEKVRSYGNDSAIINQLVELKKNRFFEEAVLAEQLFVIDGKTKISQVIENLSKEAGAPVRIAAFVRFNLGEGIEKQETDFAQEVRAAAGA